MVDENVCAIIHKESGFDLIVGDAVGAVVADDTNVIIMCRQIDKKLYISNNNVFFTIKAVNYIPFYVNENKVVVIG